MGLESDEIDGFLMDDLLLIPTATDVERTLAKRLRAERKRQGWTQAQLASRSGLSVATIARLESTGQGQVYSLVRMVGALGHLSDFAAILKPVGPKTLEELREMRRADSR